MLATTVGTVKRSFEAEARSFTATGQAQAVAVAPGGDIIVAEVGLPASELLLARYLG